MSSKIWSYCVVIIIAVLWMGILPICAQDVAHDNSSTEISEAFQGDIFSSGDEAKVMPAPDFKTLIVRMALALGIIIFCIVVVVVVFSILVRDNKRILHKRERYLDIVDRLYLDHKKAIYLIKIVDEILVVGSSNDGLRLLSKITDSEKVASLASREFLPLLSLFRKKIPESVVDHERS